MQHKSWAELAHAANTAHVRNIADEKRRERNRRIWAQRRERWDAFKDARAWVGRYHNADQHHACCHGHVDCSDVRGGRCLDETLTAFPRLA